jgi:thioredoxin 1
VVEQLAGEHKDVKFLAIDAHNNYDTAAQFGIMGLPTLLFFKGGKEDARLVGYQQKPKIEEAIKKVKSLSQ